MKRKSSSQAQPAPNPSRPPGASQLNLSWLSALFAQALAAHQSGRLAEAERIYKQILATRPDHFDSLHLLGVIYLQSGRYVEGLRQIDLALKRDRRNVHALSNRAGGLHELRRYAEAISTCDRALAIRPDVAEAHSNRANSLYALGRFEEALASCDRALALNPNYIDALCNRAATLHELKRYDEALASCDRALMLQPTAAEAYSNRGNSLYALGRLAEALASCDCALALRPDYAPAYCNRGNILFDLHRYEEALSCYDRALALRPDFAEAHSNRGNALQQLRRFDEALASYERAQALRPDYAETHCNYANVLRDERRFDEALISYERALALQPVLADGHLNAAICHLAIGDLARGWEHFEWRWEAPPLNALKRNFPQPQWRGGDEIAGKTILLYAEQGFGDTLQFCRYVPLVAERAARVIFEVPKPLQALMGTLPGGAHVICRGDALPQFDLHCPLLSLPLAFATRLETIPSQAPYLFAPQDRVELWRGRFGSHDRPRVGLVWAGDPRKGTPGANRIDRVRSMTFDQLTPVLDVSGVEFYSLQKGDEAVAQLRASALRSRVIDWTDDLADFADTAALIENLDLVIAVDTSVVHLAGALNKPFWLLNRYNTCWRWLLDRDDSPWYPSARQFRQDESRAWAPVVARVAAALAERARDFSA